MKWPLFKGNQFRVLTEQFLVLCPSSQHTHPFLLYYYFIFFFYLCTLKFRWGNCDWWQPHSSQISKFWPKLSSSNYSHYWYRLLSSTTVTLIPASGNKDLPVSTWLCVFGSTVHPLIFVKVTILNFANKNIISYSISLNLFF